MEMPDINEGIGKCVCPIMSRGDNREVCLEGECAMFIEMQDLQTGYVTRDCAIKVFAIEFYLHNRRKYI